ncbi:MAG: hypothetical protein MJH10_18170 [Epibacterium sp.]|nr:hypothetical protein [Epibacterium sp.]NQX75416.1 hypothetical protein [Epibacterium sp.]
MKPQFWHIGQSVHTRNNTAGTIIAFSKATDSAGFPYNVMIANHERKAWASRSSIKGWHGKTNMSVEALQEKYITSKHDVITSMDDYMRHVAKTITKK